MLNIHVRGIFKKARGYFQPSLKIVLIETIENIILDNFFEKGFYRNNLIQQKRQSKRSSAKKILCQVAIYKIYCGVFQSQQEKVEYRPGGERGREGVLRDGRRKYIFCNHERSCFINNMFFGHIWVVDGIGLIAKLVKVHLIIVYLHLVLHHNGVVIRK